MKKASLIINLVLVVAVAVLYVLHFSAPKTKSSSFASHGYSAAPSVAMEGIVYINIDSVLNNYELYTDISKDLEEKFKAKDSEMLAKQRQFENSVTSFQEKIQKGLVTRAEAAELEQKLKGEQQGLVELQQQMAMELREEEQVSQRKVINAIMEYLKTLEGEQGYQYVLGTTFGGNVLYANDSLNITTAVIDGLNLEYEEKKEE